MTEHRAVVTWAGAGEPIMLAVYDTGGEVVSIPLSPVRALELAQVLAARAVTTIKTNQWGPKWPG